MSHNIAHYSASVCAGDVIELVDGATSSEGRVQITRNGFKGTVCDDNFDMAAASVVCRMLQLGCVHDIFNQTLYLPVCAILIAQWSCGMHTLKYSMIILLIAKELCHICRFAENTVLPYMRHTLAKVQAQSGWMTSRVREMSSGITNAQVMNSKAPTV